MWASGVKVGVFASRVSVRLDTEQVLTSGPWLKVEFGTTTYDGLSEFDIVTNHRFTAVATGYYHVAVSVSLFNSDDGKGIRLRLVKNGTYVDSLAGVMKGNEGGYGSETPVMLAQTLYLEAEDYLEVEVFQNNPSDRSIGIVPSFLTIDRIA